MTRIMRPLRFSTAVVFAAVLLALLAPGAHWLRLVVGLPLVMLLPGRALLMAFDPERSLGVAERLAISIALSITVSIAGGMLLAVSPLTLTTGGCVLLLSAVTLAGEAIALHRGADEAEETAAAAWPAERRASARKVGLSLVAMLLIVGVTVLGAAYRPSSGELLQMWMLPVPGATDGSVQIGVEKTISEASDFNLQYYQGSETASETPLTLRPGVTKVFERAPLIETTESAPPLGSRLEAIGGLTSSRIVSWWRK